MPDLGKRGNVMGPQPIASRKPVPPPLLEGAQHLAELMNAHRIADAVEMAVPQARGQLEKVAQDAAKGSYRGCEIVGIARINVHYYVKVRMAGAPSPFVFQARFGEREGRWMVWDAVNLSGDRMGWTK